MLAFQVAPVSYYASVAKLFMVKVSISGVYYGPQKFSATVTIGTPLVVSFNGSVTSR